MSNSTLSEKMGNMAELIEAKAKITPKSELREKLFDASKALYLAGAMLIEENIQEMAARPKKRIPSDFEMFRV